MSKGNSFSSDQGELSITRLATFARIAIAAEKRSLGVKTLGTIIEKYLKYPDFSAEERFLPAAARYGRINSGTRKKEWLISSVIEQYIVKQAFSAYFTGQTSLPIFEKLHQLGFMNEEMTNRYNFVKSIHYR